MSIYYLKALFMAAVFVQATLQEPSEVVAADPGLSWHDCLTTLSFNLRLCVLPNVVGVVKQGFFVVEPEDAVVGLGMKAVLLCLG